jgi:signal transduction histidine kinase
MMHRQLAQMVRLVDDLLDVSRISRGKLELRRERVPATHQRRSSVTAFQEVASATTPTARHMAAADSRPKRFCTRRTQG